MERPIASLLLLLLLTATVAAAANPNTPSRTKYTTRFDNIDLDRILTSRRLVAHYVDCLLGRKRCPPEGAELKRVLPDALATRCARCSERQRDAAVRAIRLLRQRYPDLWAPLQAKWDPSGEHTRRLEQAAAAAAPAGPAAARASAGTVAVRANAAHSIAAPSAPAASSTTSASAARTKLASFSAATSVPAKTRPAAVSTTSAPTTTSSSAAAMLNPVSPRATPMSARNPASWDAKISTTQASVSSAGVGAIVGQSSPKPTSEANGKENSKHLFTFASSTANAEIPTVPPPEK